MKINIVYLYSELQAYNIIILKEFVKNKNVFIHVVHWDKNKLTPYIPPQIENVYYYERSKFRTVNELYQMVIGVNPSIIYTSGWMDKKYVFVCRKIRKKLSIPVVASSDTQWRGGKQWLNIMISPSLYKKCFSHIQISGIRQFEYARRLGFSFKNILLYNHSADINLFYQVNINYKEREYPKRLLYIGRFSPEKGLKYLVEAWNNIIDKRSWKLCFIGDGPEKDSLYNNKDIEILDFMDQTDIIGYMQKSGCFILPSTFEPWALVLHEAAAGGLPVLASNTCGAVPYFVINDYNGYTFRPGNSFDIKKAIEKIINTSERRLLEMSYNSRKLSGSITPELVAKTFLSVLSG